jgi:phosphoribosylformylglycinamidine cyclo-ligase
MQGGIIFMEDLYSKAGVDSKNEGKVMDGLLSWINKTFAFRESVGKAILPIGFFANIIDTGMGLGIALSTDGVGSKTLLAEKVKKYDTIGIDCIAMNVNDILCVGAEPISFMDYIAVDKIRNEIISEIAKGLYEGAKLAKVNIPGGEIAQVKEILHEGEGSFDIIGTALGFVKIDKIITGQNLIEGDIIIGLKSSGIHSNGLTLARKVLLNENCKDDIIYELLKPTKIYVNEVMSLMQKINIKGLANITGEGLLNILRLDSNVRYIIDDLPEVPEIFRLIKEKGNVSTEEMFKDFNMGVGFCLVISKEDEIKAFKILDEIGSDYKKIGFIKQALKPEILIENEKLFSSGGAFVKV